MSIPKMTNDLAVIQKLSDLPNSTEGLTADQLKAKFDEAGLAIQKWINEVLVPRLTAEFLPFTPTSEIGARTIEEAIQAVHDQIRGAATGNLVNGSVTREKLAVELLARMYGGRPYISMDVPTAEQNPDTDLPVGQIWLRPRFSVSNEDRGSWTASGCTVRAGENKWTVTGDQTVKDVSITQTIANAGQENDRVYVLFSIENKDNEITGMTVSLNGGEDQDTTSGVFESTLPADGSLTVKLSAKWPSTSLANGSFEVVNFTVVNIDKSIRQTADAEPLRDWPGYLRKLLPLGKYVSPEEVYIQTTNGNWWHMLPNVLPVERGGTGCVEYQSGQILYAGDDRVLKPMDLAAAASENNLLLKTSGEYMGTGAARELDLGVAPFYIAIRNGSGSVFLAQGDSHSAAADPVWETTTVTLDGRFLRFSASGKAAATHCNKNGTVYRYQAIY